MSDQFNLNANPNQNFGEYQAPIYQKDLQQTVSEEERIQSLFKGPYISATKNDLSLALSSTSDVDIVNDIQRVVNARRDNKTYTTDEIDAGKPQNDFNSTLSSFSEDDLNTALSPTLLQLRLEGTYSYLDQDKKDSWDKATKMYQEGVITKEMVPFVAIGDFKSKYKTAFNIIGTTTYNRDKIQAIALNPKFSLADTAKLSASLELVGKNNLDGWGRWNRQRAISRITADTNAQYTSNPDITAEQAITDITKANTLFKASTDGAFTKYGIGLASEIVEGYRQNPLLATGATVLGAGALLLGRPEVALALAFGVPQAVKDFTDVRSSVAMNAQLENSNLTKQQALNSNYSVTPALLFAAADIVNIGVMSTLSHVGDYAGKFARKIDLINKDLVQREAKTGAEVIAENKSILNRLYGSFKTAGLITAESSSTMGLMSGIQQFSTNLLADKQDKLDGIFNVVKQGAIEGGAMAVPFALLGGYRNLAGVTRLVRGVEDLQKQTNFQTALALQEGALNSNEKIDAYNEIDQTEVLVELGDIQNLLLRQGLTEDGKGTWLEKYIESNDGTYVHIPASVYASNKEFKEGLAQIIRPDANTKSLEELQQTFSDEELEAINNQVNELLKDRVQRSEQHLEIQNIANKVNKLILDIDKDRLPGDERNSYNLRDNQYAFGEFIGSMCYTLGKMTNRSAEEVYNSLDFSLIKRQRDVALDGQGKKNVATGQTKDTAHIELYEGNDFATLAHEMIHVVLNSIDQSTKWLEERFINETNEHDKQVALDNYNALSGMLNEVSQQCCGKDWFKLSDKEKSDVQEFFVYKMLDYIANGQSDRPTVQFFDILSNVIVSSYKSRIAKQIRAQNEIAPAKVHLDEVSLKQKIKDNTTKEDVISKIRSEYNYTDTPSPVFDHFCQAIFESQQLYNYLNNTYRLEDNNIGSQLDLEHLNVSEDTKKVLRENVNATQESVDKARQDFVDKIKQYSVEVSGAFINFTNVAKALYDKFKGKDGKGINKTRAKSWYTKTATEEDKKLFIQELKNIKNTDKDVKDLFTAINEFKIDKDKFVEDLKTLGIELSKTDIARLEKRGMFGGEMNLNDTFTFFGCGYGKKEAQRVTKTILMHKDFTHYAEYKALERVLDRKKNEYIKSLESDGEVRFAFYNAMSKVISSELKLFKNVTKTPFSAQELRDIVWKIRRTNNPYKNTSKDFLSSAQRNREKALKLFSKGMFDEGARYARNAYIAIHVAKAMEGDAVRIQRQLKELNRQLNTAKGRLAKNHYDNDTLDIARYLLAEIGVNNKQLRLTSADLRARAHQDVHKDIQNVDGAMVNPYDQALKMYDEACEILNKANDRHGYQDLTMEQTQTLIEIIQNIKHLARAEKGVDLYHGKWETFGSVVDKVVDVLSFVKTTDKNGEVVDKIGADGKRIARLSRNKDRHENGAIKNYLYACNRWLRGMLGRTSAYYHTIDAVTNGTLNSYIYQPMKRALSNGKKLSADWFMKQVDPVFKDISAELKRINRGKIPAVDEQGRILLADPHDPSKAFVFGAGENGAYGNGAYEILGMIAHMGNNSNYDKLLKGYHWKKENVEKFLGLMVRQGVITPKLFQCLEKLFDANRYAFALGDKGHYESQGFHVKEIPIRRMSLNFGGENITINGGYMPLITNAKVKNAVDRVDVNELTKDYSDAHPSLNTDWTKDRSTAYENPPILDLGRMMEHGIKVIKYGTIAPTLHQVVRLTSSQKVINAWSAYDSVGYNEFVKGFIKEAIRSVSNRIEGDPLDNSFFNSLVSNASMIPMAFNIANTLTQNGSLAAPIAFGVKPKYLMQACNNYLRMKEDFKKVLALSPYLQVRLNINKNPFYESFSSMPMVDVAQGVGNNALLRYRQFSRWSSNHAYVCQKYMQDGIDRVVVMATFNQEMDRLQGILKADGTRKYTDEECAYKALDKAEYVLDNTQSNFDRIAKSKAENGNALTKAFMAFYNFFFTSMQANVANYKMLREQGNGMLNALTHTSAFAFFELAIPTFVSTACMSMCKGELGTDDESINAFARNMIVDQFKAISHGLFFGAFFDPFLDYYLADKQFRGTDVFRAPVISNFAQFAVGIKNIIDGNPKLSNAIQVYNMVASVTGLGATAPFFKRLVYLLALFNGDIKNDRIVDNIMAVGLGNLTAYQKDK